LRGFQQHLTKKSGVVSVDEVGELASTDVNSWFLGYVIRFPVSGDIGKGWRKDATLPYL